MDLPGDFTDLNLRREIALAVFRLFQLAGTGRSGRRRDQLV